MKVKMIKQILGEKFIELCLNDRRDFSRSVFGLVNLNLIVDI